MSVLIVLLFLCSLPLLGFCLIHALNVSWIVAVVLFTCELRGPNSGLVPERTVYTTLLPSIFVPAVLISYVQSKLPSPDASLRAVLGSTALAQIMALVVSCLAYRGKSDDMVFAVAMSVAFGLTAPQLLAAVDDLISVTDAQMSGSLIGLVSECVTCLIVLVAVVWLRTSNEEIDQAMSTQDYSLFGILVASASLLCLAFIAITLWGTIAGFERKRTITRANDQKACQNF